MSYTLIIHANSPILRGVLKFELEKLLIPRKTSTLFQFFFQFESSKYAYYGTRRLCQSKTHQYGLFFKHAIVEN